MMNRDFYSLPENLPNTCLKENIINNNYPLSNFPITRYWHYERRQNIFNLAPPGIPNWLLRFDWLIGWQHGWANLNNFPRHVFCHPDILNSFDNFLKNNFKNSETESFLVVGGEDTRLSNQNKNTILSLKKYFKKIFYESYDVYNKDVEIMPIGLQEFYLRGIENLVYQLSNTRETKKHLVMSAFGAFWPNLNTIIKDRSSAVEFSLKNSFVNSGPFEREKYFENLSLHKYMICPLGNGQQSPKIIEAILNCCVPIMTSSVTSKCLKNKGFPILIVNNWFEITEKKLNEEYVRFETEIIKFRDMIKDLDRWWDFSFKAEIK